MNMTPPLSTARTSLQELGTPPGSLSGFFKRPPPPRQPARRSILSAAAEWVPPADITEDNNHYLLKVELSEVRREDIQVAVEQGVLSITGEYQFEQEDSHGRYHTVEHAYGCFSRTFVLPDDADPADIHASFDHGVLSVRVHKIPSSETPPDPTRWTLGGPLPAKLVADWDL